MKGNLMTVIKSLKNGILCPIGSISKNLSPKTVLNGGKVSTQDIQSKNKVMQAMEHPYDEIFYSRLNVINTGKYLW